MAYSTQQIVQLRQGQVVDDSRFKTWKQAVNAALSAKCGMVSDDLPDCPYRQWFDMRVSPKSAAARAIRIAKDEI